MANFVHPEPPTHNKSNPETNEATKNKESHEFENVLQGIEDIQNHCLEQHEMHLDYRVQLLDFENKFETVFQSMKSLKAKNVECEGRLHGLKCQNAQLRQTLAREGGLLLAADEKRENMQRLIDDEKEAFLKLVESHEQNMAKLSEQFRSAPITFGKEKLREAAAQEEKEVEELKKQKKELEGQIQKKQCACNQLREPEEIAQLRRLVQELQNETQKLRMEEMMLKQQMMQKRKSVEKIQQRKENLQTQLQKKLSNN